MGFTSFCPGDKQLAICMACVSSMEHMMTGDEFVTFPSPVISEDLVPVSTTITPFNNVSTLLTTVILSPSYTQWRTLQFVLRLVLECQLLSEEY